ncbi:MAG TPA: MFS transporter, partial [Roseiflexaceae bacterium]|nr:MFS transporter [Roseiflexaceae bacterium]
MSFSYTPRLGRRLIAILFATQSLASAGLIATFTVNPIVGARLSGNEALAGLPGTLLQIGAALAAYPMGRLMQRSGRRIGLSLGFFLGTIGMLIAGLAIATASFPIFLLGLAFMGASRGAIEQGRYAAADALPISQRARAISTIVFASTIGAVVGPGLVEPLGNLVAGYGLNPLAGPMFGGSTLLLIGAFILVFFLRPDPRDIARFLNEQEPEATRIATDGPVRTLGEIIRQPGIQLAVVAMIFGQVVMVLVMTVTSLHMDHHNHGLGDIGLVLSAHTLGMFGLSFFTGFVADRIGRPAT